MEVRCDRCQARYRVDDARIGPQGLTMRCGKCQNTFRVMRDAAPQPAPAKPAAPPPADEGAGRTMMFQTAPIRPPPAARTAAAPPAPPPHGPEARAFSSPAQPSRSTLVFGTPAPPVHKAAPAPSPITSTLPDSMPPAGLAATIDEAPTEMSAPPFTEESLAATGEVETPPPEAPAADSGAFDRAPPKGLIVGMAATLLMLLLAVVSLLVWKKTARRPPPPAAVEAMAAARADAEKDTLASIASAESKARDALDAAGPRARFPQGIATLAAIDVQWADALSDQAGGPEAKGSAPQGEAKSKLKAALDVLAPALKTPDAKSADVQLALADYHRAQRSPTSMNKAIRNSGVPRDDPRVAAVQGMALLQDEDGADKAIPKLKAALAGAPQSARLHFRLAQAYAAAKDEASARAELKETLRISPKHERARALLDQLGPELQNR